MSFNNNVKRSVTYQFELTHSKILAPVTRYKGYSKLYQLNLSKMLLKCPQSPFARKQQIIQPPQQLLIIRTNKYSTYPKKSEEPDKCSSDLAKSKIQSIKASIKNNLLKQDLLQVSPKTEYKKEESSEKNITPQNPNTPNIIQFPIKQFENSPLKLSKNDFFRLTRKKMHESAFQNNNKKEQEELESQIKSQTFKRSEKNQTIISSKPAQHSKKYSYNNYNNTKNRNNDNNQNLVRKSKVSKKLLLPEIKSNPQAITSNKAQLPLLTKDPQQLKHIKSQSYAILEYPSNNLILSNKPYNQYQIASLTKIMTFYTTMKIVSKYSINIFQENIKINDIAMDMSGTSAQIISGEVYTVQQLLYGLMLPSGNDAATALAEWGGRLVLENQSQVNSQTNLQPAIQNEKNEKTQTGKGPHLKIRIKTFIQQMNLHAKQIGLTSTKFANQHGLPNSQSKSTVLDVAKLCAQCLKDDFFRKVVGTSSFKCTPYQFSNPQLKRGVEWENTNKLLRRQGFIGIKTGITVTAGPCLASGYQFRDKTYICIILRANKISRRFKETRKLLCWALEKLYSGSLTAEQSKILSSLKKNKPQLDSDYSEDQQQFNYDHQSKAEFKKRNNIINYEL